jgi:hypothetical protein
MMGLALITLRRGEGGVMSEMDTRRYGRDHINSDELDPAYGGEGEGDDEDVDQDEDDEDDEDGLTDEADDDPDDEDEYYDDYDDDEDEDADEGDVEDYGDEDEDGYRPEDNDDGETVMDTAVWERDHINRDDWDPAHMLDDHSGYSSWQERNEDE